MFTISGVLNHTDAYEWFYLIDFIFIFGLVALLCVRVFCVAFNSGLPVL